MHHAHRTTVAVLHGLVMVSLLVSGLVGWIPAKAASLTPQEKIVNPISDATESVATVAAAPLASPAEPNIQVPSPLPAPGSQEAPPPEPLPAPLLQEAASETPSEYPQDAAEIAITILSEIPTDSPLLARSADEAAHSLALAALQAPVPGESLTLVYQAQLPEGSTGFSLVLRLPKGFAWLGDAALLDVESSTLRLPLALEVTGETMTFLPAGMLSFQLDPGIIGPFEIQAALLQDGNLLSELTLLLPESGLTLLPLSGGTAEGLGGRVRVTLPPGAVTADQSLAGTLALDSILALRVRPPSLATMLPSSPSGHPFEITLHSQDGVVQITRFAQPISIEVAYDETLLAGPEENLRLVYYDEPSQTWLPLPSDVNTESNLLSATSDHLSVFDLTLDSWDAARLPSLQSFQTDGFTGAATAAYSFWTPPGPAGLQPSLSLSYHSQASNTAIAGYTQGAWVGFGWELTTGSIERNMQGTLSNLSDDTFSINTGGISSRLLLGADGYYHTQDESFWRIQYNSTADTWTVWDKGGAKYIFGDTDNSRATYPYLDACASGKYIQHAAWRWSLSQASNASGQQLDYSYFEDAQPVRFRCQYTPDFANATIASYPYAIAYPGSHYMVFFDLESRPDYRSEWTTQETLILYQRYRLQRLRMERLVGGSFQTIRQYDLTYTPAIFTGILWANTAPRQATQALSTITERRTVGGVTHSLPPTTYSYNNLHLTRVENGYGGKIEYVYDDPPWYSVSSDANNLVRLYAPVSCYYTGLNYYTIYAPYTNPPTYNGGQAFCTSLNDQYLRGDTHLYTPENILQPGGVYRVQIKLTATSVSTQTYVRLQFGSGGIVNVASQSLSPYQSVIISQDVIAPAGASEIELLVGCSNTCKVTEKAKITLLPTRYRVKQKLVYDGLNPSAQTFNYHFDEPSMNDARHSAGAGGTNRDFRGHALARQSGSDGRTQFTFYRQDDIYKGRPVVEMTVKESYFAGFESGTSLEPDFTICPGAGVLLSPLYGDQAVRLTGDASERCLLRTPFGLQDNGSSPNVVSGQILLQGTAPQTRLALESSAGLGYALYMRADGALLAQSKISGSWVDQSALLQPGGIQKDVWYVFMLFLDDNEGFLARLWPRECTGTSRGAPLAVVGGAELAFCAARPERSGLPGHLQRRPGVGHAGLVSTARKAWLWELTLPVWMGWR